MLGKETHIVPARPNTYTIAFPQAYALLSMQRALLGIVTPELSAVIVDVDQSDSHNLLYLRFYYEENISTQTFDEWESAITECIADMGPNYLVDAAIEGLPWSQDIPVRGDYAYLTERKEMALRQHRQKRIRSWKLFH